MNRYFFLWYYTRGFLASFFLAINLARFVVHRFHMLGLLSTLFSPWKRDVAYQDWLGFHPLRALKLFFENLISRFLGMIVRLVVLAVGIVALVGTLLCGILLFTLYVMAPLFLFLGLVFLLINPLLGAGFLVAGGIGMMSAIIGYLSRDQDVQETADIVFLKQQPWFRKLLGRLGVENQEFTSEIFKSTETFLDFLLTRGIQPDIYERAVHLEWVAAQERFRKDRLFTWENLHKSPPIGKGWRYAYTPFFDRYALDLSVSDPTEYADATLVGREDELRMTTLVLERPSQNSVLLVGDPGIGKKILIHHLARLIRENIFEGTPMGESRVVLLDIGRVVSDAVTHGDDVDGTVRKIFGEATYAGNVIVVIENINTVLGESTAHHNLAPVLGEFLAYPNFRLIATIATGRFNALFKDFSGLLKFFETIHFHETTEDETLQVLLDFVRRLEHKGVIFTLPALLSIIAQSSRYKWEVPFPERALDLAEETLTYWQGNGDKPFITPKTVEAFVSLQTGMPTGAIGTAEKDKLLRLEEYLHARIVGQNEAVKQVAEAMRRARVGFGNAKRPLGSFIFLGPTGVGKTETVKALAESYFGDENRMIRLDMSEFQTPEAVSRLIGSEAVGVSGQLTDLVKEKPFSILLLDELEKAYPKALDLFLQILDEGFVTDSAGEKVSFRNTIIIATSNAGAPIIKAGIDGGIPFEQVRKQVLDFVVEQGIYRLEFLNRFDGVVFFEPLKQEELLQITSMKLQSFSDRLKKEKNIVIAFAPGVAEKIVATGYQPEFGARSINRYIEDTIEDVVISQIISESITPGGTISVTADQL